MKEDTLNESTLRAPIRRLGPQERNSSPPVVALTILYHPQLQRIGERALLPEVLRGGTAHLSRSTPLFRPPGSPQEQPLRDRHLSRTPWQLTADSSGVRLSPGSSSIPLYVAGSAHNQATTVSTADLERGVVLELADRIVLLLHLHHLDSAAPPQRHGLVGDSSAMVAVRSEIDRVADLEIPVLVRGETGTGKELVASALHRASQRQGAYLALNLAVLPETLAGAELFGARKGAFTGAGQGQPGFFAQADGGTLFLDEIGETPFETQAQLLRVLETGEIQPLGSSKPQSVDVRLVSATDADLEARITKGTFRAPLFHRLAGYELRLPPLRSRRDDIARLFLHFLNLELERIGEADRLQTEDATPWLAPSLVARLVELDWPGNVRQLRNGVRQLVIGSRGQPTLEPVGPAAALFEDNQETPATPSPATPAAGRRKPATVTEDEVRSTLRAQRWDLKATAETLQISRTSLYALIEKYPSIRAPADIRNHEIRQAFERYEGSHEAMSEALEISVRTLRRRLREMGLA